MTLHEYNRQAATEYARQWALKRNPKYYDFSDIGGDCTNFASQCIYAGSGVMNMTPLYGWYFRSVTDRTPSWTGAQFLYRFLIGNTALGPFCRITPLDKAEVGDVIQLGNVNGEFYHSVVMTGLDPNASLPLTDRITVAAHSDDSLDRRLSTYIAAKNYRVLHISGYRSK